MHGPSACNSSLQRAGVGSEQACFAVESNTCESRALKGQVTLLTIPSVVQYLILVGAFKRAELKGQMGRAGSHSADDN